MINLRKILCYNILMKRLFLFVLFIIFLFGCSAKQGPAFRLQNVTFSNFDLNEIHRVADALYYSVEKLRACKFFEEKYSLQKAYFDILFDERLGQSIKIERATSERVKEVEAEWQKIYDKKFGKGTVDFDIAAFANAGTRVINFDGEWLDTNLFDDPFNINLTRTVAHEILHLVDLPSHEISTVKDPEDPIETVLIGCNFNKFIKSRKERRSLGVIN